MTRQESMSKKEGVPRPGWSHRTLVEQTSPESRPLSVAIGGRGNGFERCGPTLVRRWPTQCCSTHSLTTVVQKPSIVIEVVTTFSSFRFPELSQPI